MNVNRELVLVATQSSTPLAEKIAGELGLAFSEMKRKHFADGESYHAFPCNISGKTPDYNRGYLR